MKFVPLDEQETNIGFLRNEDTARIYTADTTVMTKLDKLVESNPDTWKLVRADDYGKTYECPKKLVSFRATIIKRELTDEQKQALIHRMQKSRQNPTTD